MKKSFPLFRCGLASLVCAWFGMTTAPATDVSSLLLAKGQVFQQNSSNAPVLQPPTPWRAVGNINLVIAGGVTSATLQPPTGSLVTFSNDIDSFNIQGKFTNQNVLDTLAKPGAYHYTIHTLNDGTQTPILTLGPDNYPATPHLKNWTDAQAWDTAGAFTLSWDKPPAADTNDFVQLSIRDDNGNNLFSSPEVGEPGALTGAAASWEIPAGTLGADMVYEGRLLFARHQTSTNNSYVGVRGTTAYFKETRFPIVTLPAPPPEGRLQFSAINYSVSETGGVVNLTVTRTGGSSGNVSVSYTTVAGTATENADYTGVASAVSFAPGETNKDFPVTILDDFLLEGSELFRVTLSNPFGGAILGTRTNASVTILDNELATAGTLQFSLGAYFASEAGPFAPVTISRTGGLTSNVTVNFATSDGSATAGLHYTAVNSNLTFTPGLASKVVNIPVVNDSKFNTNRTVNLWLNHPSSGASLGLHSTAVLTITNNDFGGTIQFSLSSYNVSETGGVAHVTVTRTGGAASEVTVEFATTDLTAHAPADYTNASATLTFGSNELFKVVTIPIADDALPEGNETVQLTLRNATGGGKIGTISNAVLTIIDDEVTLQFSRTTFTNTEAGPAAVLTVSRTGPAGAAVSVQYATTNGTAQAGLDYKGTNGTLAFAPNIVSKTISIPIINDTAVEGSEVFYVNLSNPVGALLGPLSNATVNLLDNDLGGIIQFSTTNYPVTEAGPVATITITRTGGAASGVTVEFVTSNGTATAGADYTAVVSNLVFAANEVSKTVNIPVWNDSLDETNETVNLILRNPTGGASLGTRSNALLTITDNDVGGIIQFSLAAYSISETGGLATITVTRTGGMASDVSVDFATSNLTATAGADYTATNGTLHFASNQLSATFQIPITNDALPEGNETVALKLRNATGGAVLGAISNAVLTILDDESSVSFTNATYTVTEAGPSISINVVRSGSMLTTVGVSFSTVNGSAISTNDYRGTNGTLSFPPGVTFKTITIPIANDTIVEGNEDFRVILHTPTGGVLLGTITNTTVTIIDNDLAGTIQLSSSNYTVTEGSNATIRITRTGGLAGGVTVHLETSGGTATAGSDYTAVSTNLTFAAGETNKIVLIAALNDATNEPNETVSILLSNPGGGATLGTVSNATLTISDRPDPNAIPASGPEFMTANVVGFPLLSVPAAFVVGSYNSASHTFTVIGTVAGAFGQKTINLASLAVTGPGVVTLNTSGGTGSVAYTQILVGPPPSFESVASNQAGASGTVTIDVFDLASGIVTGRFTVTGIRQSTGLPTSMTGSFRAFIP